MKNKAGIALAVIAGLALVVGGWSAPGLAEPGDRVALVIGNNAYKGSPLRNAVNDAEDLAKTLTELGFSVQKVTDADLRTMERAVNEFIRRIPKGGTALFYYSGHGIQVDGGNYLVPIGFKAEDAVDAKYEAYSAERVLDRMEGAPSKLNVIVLDACRDNPFRGARGGGKGLALMNAGDGSLIAYATAPGKTASDNPRGRNGLFTTHLLVALRLPGLQIEEVFKKAREGVHKASDGTQVPWTASSVIGKYVLRRGGTPSNSEGSVRGSVTASLTTSRGKKISIPVGGATIEVRPAGSADVAGQGASDDLGVYLLSPVPAGKWVVAVRKDGYDEATKEVSVSGGKASLADIVLTAGTAAVMGRVTDTEGRPALGAIVRATVAYGDGREEIRSTMTAADGSFELPNLPTGEYLVEARLLAGGALRRASIAVSHVGGRDTKSLRLVVK